MVSYFLKDCLTNIFIIIFITFIKNLYLLHKDLISKYKNSN